MIQVHAGGNWQALMEVILPQLPPPREVYYNWIYICSGKARGRHLKEQFWRLTDQVEGLEPPFWDQQEFLNKFVEILPPPMPLLTRDDEKCWLIHLLRENRDRFRFVFTESGEIPLERLNELLEFILQLRLQGDSPWVEVQNAVKEGTIWEEYLNIAKLYNETIKNRVFDEVDWLKYLIDRLDTSHWQALFPHINSIYWEIKDSFPLILTNLFRKFDQMGLSVNLICHYADNTDLFVSLKDSWEALQNLTSHIHLVPDPTHLSTAYFQFQHSTVYPKSNPEIWKFSHWLTEVDFIARYIKKIIIDEEVPANEIAIAAPNLSDYLPAIENAFYRYGIPMERLTFQSLTEVLPVQHLMLLPEMVQPGASLQTVQQILTSPFFLYHELLEGINVASILKELRVNFDLALIREQLKKQIRLLEDSGQSEWEEDLKKKIEHYKKVLQVIDKLQADLAIFQSHFTADDLFRFFTILFEKHNLIPRLLSWATHITDIEVATLLEAFRGFVARLENWVHIHTYFPRTPEYESKDLLPIFKFLLQEGGFFPLQPRHSGVRIIPLREVENVSVKVLFAIGLNEKNFPIQEIGTPPDLPPPMHRIFMKKQMYDDRRQFVHILQHPFSRLILSYCEWEGESPQLPSEVIFELQRLTGKKATSPQPLPVRDRNEIVPALLSLQFPEKNLHQLWQKMENLDVWSERVENFERNRNIVRERLEGKPPGIFEGNLGKDVLIRNFLKDYYRNYSFSVSALETYAYCPMRYFLQRVLKIEEPSQVEDWLTPGEKGSLVHRILYRFFSEYEANSRTRENLLNIVREEMRSGPIPQSLLWDLQIESFVGSEVRPGLFPSFWEYEQQLQQNYPAQPTYFEYAFGSFPKKFLKLRNLEWTKEFAIRKEQQEIFLKGIVDRIEITPDGGVVIIDYKTGTYPGLKELRLGYSLQLPVYLYVITELFKKQNSQFYPLAAGYYLVKGDRKDQIKKELLFSENRELFENLIRIHLIIPGEMENEKSVPELLNRSLNYVLHYVEQIKEGIFLHTLERSHCERNRKPICPYRGICRVNFNKQQILKEKEKES